MPLSFPSNPSVNQTVTTGGRVYRWTGAAWEFQTAASPNVLAWTSVPASATAAGTAGQVAYDGSYFYVCTAPSTWIRYSGATWSTFTPASVSGLQGWWDARDATNLYDATSGGSQVVSGGTVARWADKSGNNRHLTQSTSGNRPTLIANGKNGLPVLRFAADWLDLSSFSLAQPYTVFAVWKPTIAAAYLFDDTTRSGAFVAAGLKLNDTDSYFGFYAGSVIETTDTHANAWMVGATVVNGASSSIFINGTQKVAANTGSNSIASIRLGASYAGAFSGSDIAEFVIYNSALSDTDRAAIESYLIGKWGIS